MIIILENNMTIKRMWINQPSTAQPLHDLHGTNVLCEDSKKEVVRIYFLSGDVVSQNAPRLCLDNGWGHS